MAEPSNTDVNQRPGSKTVRKVFLTSGAGILVLGGILLTRLQGYLLFHGVAEVFSIVIACAVFIYAWNARKLLHNSYLMVIGISFVCYSLIALVHTLSFKGMGVFPANSANLPTQLWIAGRYLLAVSFLAAPSVAGKSVKPWAIFAVYSIVTSLVFLSIFHWHIFPACYVDGKGLTQFKIYSEYIISAVFLLSILALFRKRTIFETSIFWLIVTAIFVTISSEIAFTRYVGVYSSANLIGHLLNIVAFYLFYEAILVTGFQTPIDTLFKDKNQAIEKLNESNDWLRQSNAKLDLALHSAHMGVWQWDIVTGKRTFDVHTCAMLGLDPAKFSGEAAEFFAVIHPDDRQNIKAALERAIKEGVMYESDYRAVWPDGSIHYISSRGRPVRDKEGVPRSISGIAWDITGSKHTEEMLRDSQERFRYVLENVLDAVWSANLSGRYEFLSPRMADIYGLPITEMTNNSNFWLEAVYPEDKALVSPSAKALFRDGRVEIEYRIILPGGTVKWILDRKTLVRNTRGEPSGMAGIVSDITKRKQAEDILRTSQERFQEVLDNSQDAAYKRSLTSNSYEYLSPVFAKITGFTPNEMNVLPVESVVELMHPDDRANVESSLGHAIANAHGTAYTTEYRFKRKDGQYCWLQDSFTVMGDANGKPLALIGSVSDITVRKQSEEKIKASLAEKEVLLKEIHHRVKNNMQVISSLLRMQSGFLKDADDKRMFQESQERIQSMSLVYNKLYQSENLASISFGGYVDDLVGNLIKSHNSRDVPPRVLIDIDGIELSLDFAIPCGLIINEVVTNALKYAFPQGQVGQIHIIIRQKEDRIEMSLGDDGIGLPEGLTIGSTKSLGMVLIQTLAVHQLGGTLELKREKGTEYCINFPLVFEG